MQRSCLPIMLVAVAAGACADDGDETTNNASGLTYYGDAKAIVDARCATCHRIGDIGPFPMTSYDEVTAFAPAIRASIENGTMPPWQPSDDCNDYLGNIDLQADEKETLLAWLDAGAPSGDPAEAPEDPAPTTDGFEPNLTLLLPEAYTPTREPDDYRCQLIPWPAEDTQYVTGLRVKPDQRSIVHHVIVFVASPDEVEQFRAYDEAEDGPGYTCYGGPRGNDSQGGSAGVDLAGLIAALDRAGLTLADLRAGNVTEEQLATLMAELGDGMAGGFASIGSWVPGVLAAKLPEGTGIRVEPGSMLVAQFHYNTLTSAPVADQSTIEISVADTVEKEATNLAVLDVGWVSNGLIGDPMSIPAGEANVQHATTIPFDSLFMAAARQTLGLASDSPLVIHRANHHMHELGRTQRTELRHADGSTSCVLDIPDWDFAWQGSYQLARPMPLQAGDMLWMGCSWDNTAANQPIIDGVARQPVDVAWGEGTSDEMCLGSFYVTGP